MTRKKLIALATNWGPQHGGINSFNYDFLSALGVAFHGKVLIICVVPSATIDEIDNAKRSFVDLRPLQNPPGGERLE